MPAKRSCITQLADFRRVALQWHPDLNASPEASLRFRECCYAWARDHEPTVLLWNGQVETVDRGAQVAFSDFSLAQAYGVFAQTFTLSTLFSWQPNSPDTLVVPVPLHLHDVLLGNFKTLQFTCRDVCPECSGTGRVPAAGTCGRCAGEGLVSDEERVRFEVVPGCMGGCVLHLPGEGEYSSKFSRRGDLLLVFQENLPRNMRRDGAHVEIPAAVDAWTLVLGGGAQVRDLQGERMSFRIPAGVMEGATLKISGRGLPYFHRNGRGDLILRLQARFPEGLDGEELELVQQLQDRRRYRDSFPLGTAGAFALLELSPNAWGPDLEERLLDTLQDFASQGRAFAVDLRKYEGMVPEMVVSALLNVYHKFVGQGQLLLLGPPSLLDGLSRLQVASLFRVVADPASLASIEPAPPLCSRTHAPRHLGRWEVFDFSAGPLNSAVLLDRPDYLEALDSAGSLFRALELSQVVSVDSFTIGKLVQLYRYVHASQGEVALIGVQDAVARVLRDTGVFSLFTIVDKIDALDN